MPSTASLLIPPHALAQLPTQLRGEVLSAFEDIVSNFSQGRWGPAELDGGKLCEAAYCVCEGLATGTMPTSAKKPKDIVGACKALEQHTSAPRSIRIQIPRMIVALYEVRNNRNVGHLGGDVDPSHMDAVCVLQMSKWIVAELIRVLHQLPVDAAADLVEALVEREVPLVWKVGDVRRVLVPGMKYPDKTLLLLHGCAGATPETDLFEWAEHDDERLFRRDVLRRLHKRKLLEYDDTAETVIISPLGVDYVERALLPRHRRPVAAAA